MKFLSLFLVLLLSACTTTSSYTYFDAESSVSNTMQIIHDAAEAVPKGVSGKYLLNIKATGEEKGIVYLNTEEDYRDPRNVTVAIHPKVVPALKQKFGGDLQTVLVGKSLSVEGTAKRVKINFISGNRPPTKYYYQTHIRIKSTDQIDLI